MPYRLGKGGKCGDTGWGVYKRDTGELVACHTTRRLAAAQFRLLEMITHEETKAATLKAWMVKYSEDQARDDHGRFGSGGGSSDPYQQMHNISREIDKSSEKIRNLDSRQMHGVYGSLISSRLLAGNWQGARQVAREGLARSRSETGTAGKLSSLYEKAIAIADEQIASGKSAKYSEDQERDDHGRFGSGGGDSFRRNREADIASHEVSTLVPGGGTIRDENIHDSLMDVQGGYIESLSKDQLQAVADYQSEIVYSEINDGLRQGTDLSPERADTVAALDKIIGSSELDQITLYRGIVDSDGRFENIFAGDTLKEPGYSSTSPNPLVAESFSENQNADGDPVVLVISAAAGQPGIAADLCTERLTGANLLAPDEMMNELAGWTRMNEVILPRDLTMNVNSVKVADNIKYVNVSIGK